MRKRPTHLVAYRALRIEGGLIPAEELNRLTLLDDPKASEQTDAHYRIPRGLKLRDEIARDFRIALQLWQDFQPLRQRRDSRALELTVRNWLLPLLRDVLHFHDAAPAAPIERGGHRYAIGHAGNGGRVPLILAGVDEPLDSPAERCGDSNPDTGRLRRRSPFMLAQEALNASDEHLWALVSNGLTLRILRDNASLTRPAYLEIDLETLFNEGLLADFSALWLLAHASRFPRADAPVSDCPWERWRAAGQDAGVTVREQLRNRVAEALRELGTGFLCHPDNTALRAALGSGGLSAQAYYEQLLGLVYRLIFLATVEDRRDRDSGERLIFTPDADQAAKQRYLAGYSMTWLRERAVRRGQHDRHDDLWQALSITLDALARGEPALGLPALGGLFEAANLPSPAGRGVGGEGNSSTGLCPDLDHARLANQHLLAAVFQLGWFRETSGLSRVNYRDMGPEELGSVYESLLELVPEPTGLGHPASARLRFVGDDGDAAARGSKRKLTGSYYTPDSLVQQLIQSALDPVIQSTVATHPERPVEALLNLSVCDPACGSGHFLLAAARRLAEAVAQHRALIERDGGAPLPTDYRRALRDVVSRCLYGVDKNPMAIQLAKTALWLEAYTPERPLSFLDHHLRVGDALLGVLKPEVLAQGIPEAAYKPLTGDDPAVATLLKQQNREHLASFRQISAGDLLSPAELGVGAAAVEALSDDTPAAVAAKRKAWTAASTRAHSGHYALLADCYVAAFLSPKQRATLGEVPLTADLWGVAQGEHFRPAALAAAQARCRQHSVFHWGLAFPQVMARGGFDVMLGNPPWERIKLQEEEYFAHRSPLVAAARNKAERSRRIEWLREGLLLHNADPDRARAEGLSPPNRAEIALHQDFQIARRGAEAASLYAHDSGRFPLTGVGDVNTYALFAETFLQATAPHGRAGFIVPTGIATDDSTKAYFSSLVSGNRISSLYSFYEIRRWFPATDDRKAFCLLTIGPDSQAEFNFDVKNWEDFAEPEKRYRMSTTDFQLINPNTLTLPVFRSKADAELTKKLYRAAPVLIREAAIDANGEVLTPEINPWGIRFQRMLDMANDSSLFADGPAGPGKGTRLPLYEAKMIHHYDHRWATYVDTAGEPGEVETADVSDARKADPAFRVRPRYWVDEREVLARIARVPARVAKGWRDLHAARVAPVHRHWQTSVDAAAADLRLALAQWVVAEFLLQVLGPDPATWRSAELPRAVSAADARMKAEHAPLAAALAAAGIQSRKALTEIPKWARQQADTRLGAAELAALPAALKSDEALLGLLDDWMDQRSPRWLMGWRDICRSTDERTVIASVMPRVGVGHTTPMLFTKKSAALNAALLGNWLSLTFDYIARNKVGGTHLTYGYLKQFPVLPPERYSAIDLAYIVPRVLELTWTADDLTPWGRDLADYDPRPLAERRPYGWNPTRRADLRAELDAYYARLYGLTREELCYILDPKDVMGADYPSETFRVLRDNEERTHGEYRTRRLVLAAWDQLTTP